MKKILLLLMMLSASMGVWAEDYITDVMVIGGSKSEINALKSTYTAQGWTVIDQDLNKGCGSSSDYIYLLYKSASETDVDPGAFITDFVISTATGSIPDNFSYNNYRTYQLVPFDGSDYFKNNKGDLNSHCGSSSATIHLYFTREYDPDGKDYSTVKSIAFNNTQSGAVTETDGSNGYDLNAGAGGDYIYMHADKAQGWQLSVNTAGTQCHVTGFDGPKRNFKDIVIPTAIDGATLLGFSMTFSGFANLETMFFPLNSSITQMPSVQGCSKFYNVKTGNKNYQTPSSMTSIPGYAFAGTAIEQITFQSVTSVGSDVFSGCKKLSSVTFKKSPVLIENHAFSNIKLYCSVSYPGSIEDWNPMMYMYSPMLVVNGPNNSWHCGWCGGSDAASNNHLYWTLQNNHLKINCATDIWDAYPRAQVITSRNWQEELVPLLTIEHVDSIPNGAFDCYTLDEDEALLETLQINSGTRIIGRMAFAGNKKLNTVYLPSSVTRIEAYAFTACNNLHDVYFDGTDEQWNDTIVKESQWNYFVAADYKEHWHCVVTYNANGHGRAPDPVSILWSNEDKLDEPNAPSADGYIFTGWYTNAACTNRWDFNNAVPGDMTLYAKWEIQQFAITLPESFENGSVTCDKTEAAEGETVTLTVTPDDGYELETLTVTIVDATTGAPLRANVDVTPGENGTYTFAMPAAPVTVSATFMETASLRGDVNEDDKVDVSDVNMMINMILGKQDETAAADLDGSGNVDVSDVNELINIILGK